jgi:KUP system potassium uptake protein
LRLPGGGNAVAAPVAAVEFVFLASNLTKIGDGGYVPVLVAASLR